MMSTLFDAKTALTRALVDEIIVGRHEIHDRQMAFQLYMYNIYIYIYLLYMYTYATTGYFL